MCGARSALPRSSVSGWTTVAMAAVYRRLERREELQHHRRGERSAEGAGGSGYRSIYPASISISAPVTVCHYERQREKQKRGFPTILHTNSIRRGMILLKIKVSQNN